MRQASDPPWAPLWAGVLAGRRLEGLSDPIHGWSASVIPKEIQFGLCW